MYRNPKVSIVIPTYNVEKYIKETIYSVLKQTFQDFEVIVVDDNSIDSTVSILKQFNDSRIRIVRNKTNMGPSFSRNKGISLSKGEWIALLDGDDFWRENRLEELLKISKENNADIVADDIYIFENERVVGTILERRKKQNIYGFISVEDFVKYDLGIMQPLIKREIFVNHKLRYNENLKYIEDFDLYLRILKFGYKWFQTNEAYYYYRQLKNSSIRNQIALKHSSIEQINSFLENFSVEESLKKQLIKRREKAIEDLRYAKVVSNIKRKHIKEGGYNLFKDPGTIIIILKKIPVLIKYRLKKYIRI
jgi:succinoglycan biosynthesis protein ExoO